MKAISEKKLVLVRHAKSSRKDFSLKDFDRPLNKRGKRDAPIMAEKFKESYFIPDLLISSPAKRASATAKIFNEHFGRAFNQIIFEQSLYHCDEEDVEAIVELLEDNINTVMVFAHNPCFTYMANDYGSVRIDNVPTCGICILEAQVESWSEFFKKANLTKMLYPKMFL